MGYRSRYNRRLRAVQRLQKRLVVAALLGAAACAAGFVLVREPVLVASGQVAGGGAMPARLAFQSRITPAATPAHGGARKVYPFSVVPGGLSGRTELAHALHTDQVVAQHYAGLQVEKVDTVRVSKPRAVYVSYRKGDKIYWTSKKVMLAEGETLLSDGSNEIRTRCGNRISDVPRLPVAADEPPAEVLDMALSMDPEDDGGDDGRQAGTASPAGGADGTSTASQLLQLAGSTDGNGPAPVYGGGSGTLATTSPSGMTGGSAPSTTKDSAAVPPPVMLSAQTGTATDSNLPSGTPGTAGGSTTDGSGTGTASSSDSGSGGTSGGTSGTPSTTTPLLDPSGGPSTDGPKAEAPPAPGSTPRPGGLQVIQRQPVTTHAVPEPDSLWLSATGLALVLLLRRKPRRALRG